MFWLGWLVWAVLAFVLFGTSWVPTEYLRWSDMSGYYFSTNYLSLWGTIFVVAWPLFGWVTYEN